MHKCSFWYESIVIGGVFGFLLLNGAVFAGGCMTPPSPLYLRVVGAYARGIIVAAYSGILVGLTCSGLFSAFARANEDKLENVCITYEDLRVKVSRGTQDVWLPDKKALFSLQVGLAYNIAQTLFYSKRQRVVEGLTDYWILKCLDADFEGKGIKQLRKDAIITPARALFNILYFI